MFFVLSKLLPWLVSPPVWLLALLIGALAARTPRRRLQYLRAVAILVLRYASARFPSVPSYPPRRTLRQPAERDGLGEE